MDPRVNVDWGSYVPFNPGVTQPLHEVSARDARAAFDRLMKERPRRLEELAKLLAEQGVALSSSDGGIQDVNDWFRRCVEADPNSPGRLRPVWYSVVNDLALFLGETIIARSPSLGWVLFDKGKKDVSFQRHVISGFTQVANPKYNIDIDRLVATYGHQIVSGQDVQADAFAQWLAAAKARA
jgi:hypothetical protein